MRKYDPRIYQFFIFPVLFIFSISFFTYTNKINNREELIFFRLHRIGLIIINVDSLFSNCFFIRKTIVWQSKAQLRFVECLEYFIKTDVI